MRVSSSKKYVRNGYDLHTEIHIHLLQAVLGDEVEIETVDSFRHEVPTSNVSGANSINTKEKLTLKIPAGTQNGKVFRLKNYGVKKLREDERGDFFVKIIVDVPGKTSRREKELYLQLAKEAKLELKGKDGILSKMMNL